MFLAKVIGKTWSDHKHYSYDGIDIKIIRDVNPETGGLINKPIFALDAIGTAIGEIVAYEVSAEAGKAFEDKKVLADATITAIIDSVDIVKGDGK